MNLYFVPLSMLTNSCREEAQLFKYSKLLTDVPIAIDELGFFLQPSPIETRHFLHVGWPTVPIAVAKLPCDPQQTPDTPRRQSTNAFRRLCWISLFCTLPSIDESRPAAM
jgi:hypothetical protein